MKYASAFLARFTLTSKDTKVVDTFDLRLRRIEQAEAKKATQHVLFKTRRLRQAA